MSGLDIVARRHRRAALAERVLAAVPQVAHELDWDTLDHAPAWMTLAAHKLHTLECRLGALLCAPALKLWIDRPRMAAAREAVGAPFLLAVMAQPESSVIRAIGASTPLHLASADQVGALLRAAGAAALMALLPAGTLQRVAASLLAAPAPIDITADTARELLACAHALAPEGEPS